VSAPEDDGPPWFAWTEEPQPCGWCEEPVQSGDLVELTTHWDGERPARRPWHRACRIRSVLGGLNHLQGRCTCCGGTEPPDPPELSRRAAALAAVAWMQDHVVGPSPWSCDPKREKLS
jgi:hypothetical protein